MIITIKEVSEEIKPGGEPKHIEWTAIAADAKEIKVKLYPSIQVEGQWFHFEDRWDELKNAKDKTYEIERATVKLENNRTWKPVIKATEVKDVFVQEAHKKVTDDSIDSRQLSIEGQVAFKEIGEMIRAENATFMRTHQDLVELYFIKLYDLMNKFVYGGQNEPAKNMEEPQADEKVGDKPVEPPSDVGDSTPREDDTGGDERARRLSEIKVYYKELGFNKAMFENIIKDILGTETKAGDVPKLSLMALTSIESKLRVLAKK